MRSILIILGFLAAGILALAQRPMPDAIPATDGSLTIQPITHASISIRYRSDVILIDPARFGPGLPPAPKPTDEEVAQAKRALAAAPLDGEPAPATLVSAFFIRPGQLAPFSALPTPTLILVTDIHTDHLDPRANAALKSPATRVIVPTVAGTRLLDVQGAELMANGQTKIVGDVTIEAVPMYNLLPERESGRVLHTKGRGNGYVLTIAGERIYVAGDTSCTPEMRALKRIDVAFVPMNLPYTMAATEAAECVNTFRPRIVYPYHYFDFDPKLFESALRGSGIEVRLRDWYATGQPARK